MHVVSVCSLKGGVGKTSVVLGLASAAQARGVPTLVVDLDPQGDATAGLDVEGNREVEVADVLTSSRRSVVESAIVPSGWTPDSAGAVDVMVGGPRTAEHDIPGLDGRRLHRLGNALRKLDGAYRLVLVDCPPSLGGLTRTGLAAADHALVVTEPALFALSSADRALHTVEELRRGPAPDLQPLGVVVNRVRGRSSEHDYRLKELRSMFGPLVLSPMLPERNALQHAQGLARPLHDQAAPAAKELAQSFDRLLARVLRARPRRRRD
jgi:cellulose biosynthesis protein BcsQ